MSTTEAPGLTADWLNAWLAAIGITVLVPEGRLSWSHDPVSAAIFECPSEQPLAAVVADRLPRTELLGSMAIARRHSDASSEFARKVNLGDFRSRASIARRTHDPSLSSSVTDLDGDDSEAAHSPFDPPAPQGKTLYDRFLSCHEAVCAGGAESNLQQTLAGTARRVRMNGLGFDYRRLGSTDTAEGPMVDPVVEVLAFYGLTLIPFRGTGSSARARGFIRAKSREDAFAWPTWNVSLDIWAIDAVLDRFWSSDPRSGSAVRPPMSAAYGSVAYQPLGSADVSRGYGSRRIV